MTVRSVWPKSRFPYVRELAAGCAIAVLLSGVAVEVIAAPKLSSAETTGYSGTREASVPVDGKPDF
jgi:hypothetical protein